MTSPGAVPLGAINLIVVEDSATDVELEVDALREAGLTVDVRPVDTEIALRAALDERLPDAILADWTLPDFSGRMALDIARERCPEVPFIFVSGTISDAAAFEGMRRGAVDYVYKHQLQQLGHVMTRALEEINAHSALRQSEEKYRLLFESSRDALLLLRPPSSLFDDANQAALQLFGITSMAKGTELGPSDVSPERQPDGRLSGEKMQEMIETALREGSHFFEWEHRRLTGETFPTDVLLTRVGTGAEFGVQVTIRDITERRLAEVAMRDHIAQLERAISGTVGAVSKMMGMRDPYTSGHEARVGEISAAIAAEMGLDLDRQQGLRVAGSIHDVGKITVPAEILSKPGKLSAIEYSLIQQHAQQGYEVLKDIEFPWPVAEVARQHHERIDGSGYPRGLKGEAILLEARILAVADVIEAMVSHRPYRAGLGIDMALAEIERGRGKAYDANAADACMRLFREKKYAIPT